MAQPFAVLMTTNQKPEEERYGVSKIDLLLQKHRMTATIQYYNINGGLFQLLLTKTLKLKHSVDTTQRITHSNHKREKIIKITSYLSNTEKNESPLACKRLTNKQKQCILIRRSYNKNIQKHGNYTRQQQPISYEQRWSYQTWQLNKQKNTVTFRYSIYAELRLSF